MIFGTITYEVRGTTSDKNAVYLNDIHIDIMDYIVPATCSDTEFRHMWAEFEWENKVRGVGVGCKLLTNNTYFSFRLPLIQH